MSPRCSGCTDDFIDIDGSCIMSILAGYDVLLKRLQNLIALYFVHYRFEFLTDIGVKAPYRNKKQVANLLQGDGDACYTPRQDRVRSRTSRSLTQFQYRTSTCHCGIT